MRMAGFQMIEEQFLGPLVTVSVIFTRGSHATFESTATHRQLLSAVYILKRHLGIVCCRRQQWVLAEVALQSINVVQVHVFNRSVAYVRPHLKEAILALYSTAWLLSLSTPTETSTVTMRAGVLHYSNNEATKGPSTVTIRACAPH